MGLVPATGEPRGIDARPERGAINRDSLALLWKRAKWDRLVRNPGAEAGEQRGSAFTRGRFGSIFRRRGPDALLVRAALSQPSRDLGLGTRATFDCYAKLLAHPISTAALVTKAKVVEKTAPGRTTPRWRRKNFL